MSDRYSAPFVRYPFGNTKLLYGGLIALGVLSGCGCFLLLWHSTSSLGYAASGVSLLGWLIALGCSVRYCLAAPSGILAWNGAEWSLHLGDESLAELPVPTGVRVLRDFQSQLCLVAEEVGGRRYWLWMERSRLPERWGDLRRAVYSPARLHRPSAAESISSSTA